MKAEKGLLARLFGKKKPDDALAAAAEQIALLERQTAAKRKELDAARQNLTQHFQNDLVEDGAPGKHPSQAAEIVELQAQVEALADLTKQARQEALALIATEGPNFDARIAQAESEILEARKASDAKRAEAVARAARVVGQKPAWPGPHNAGHLGIPATALSEEEWAAIFSLVEQEPLPDNPGAAEQGRLQRELEALTVLRRSTPELALDYLVSRHRRLDN